MSITKKFIVVDPGNDYASEMLISLEEATKEASKYVEDQGFDDDDVESMRVIEAREVYKLKKGGVMLVEANCD